MDFYNALVSTGQIKDKDREPDIGDSFYLLRAYLDLAADRNNSGFISVLVITQYCDRWGLDDLAIEYLRQVDLLWQKKSE